MQTRVILRDGTAQALQMMSGFSDGLIGEFCETMTEISKVNAPKLTGNLAASIDFKKKKERFWRIFTRCGYGAYVELGTRVRAGRHFIARAFQETVSIFKGRKTS